jgi:hypothetical protein
MRSIADVSDSLQNLILQHASIDTFLKHYLDRRINADLLKIHRGMKPEKELMRFACSMSRSIDPRRPWKLTTEQSVSINNLPCIVKLTQRTEKLSGALEGSPEEEKYLKLVDAFETRSSGNEGSSYIRLWTVSRRSSQSSIASGSYQGRWSTRTREAH